MRTRLIEAADATPPGLDLAQVFVVNRLDGSPGGARYDLDPSTSLAAIADQRGICAAAAYIELQLESDGALVCSFPFLNQQMSAVEYMLDEQLVTLGLADAGAHVGQILDASQPTFLLSYWIRERKRWSVEEGIRRLTSDTADLFGLAGRGRLAAGSFADVNVIDFEALDAAGAVVRLRLPAWRRSIRAGLDGLRLHARQRQGVHGPRRTHRCICRGDAQELGGPVTDTAITTEQFVCPRCDATVDERFYGPCQSCRTELRAKFLGEGRIVEVAEYEPKMNVTPNAVALKDD